MLDVLRTSFFEYLAALVNSFSKLFLLIGGHGHYFTAFD
jgi:hypothetical protein